MSDQEKVKINLISTGVQGLDQILGGGLPEFSFNIIGGAPGCGKTTLAHQIIFATTSPERPALYFTVFGEPAIKMLRYQQQYKFFDQSKLNREIHFVNLSDLARKKNLNAVLEEMKRRVDALGPSLVVVDSFRTVMRMAQTDEAIGEHQAFIQDLSLHLASWQATTFLIGEYTEEDIRNNPVFTVADGLLWLSQQVDRNSVVRKLQVMKLRGQASVPGLHTIRITDFGLQAFPRDFGLIGIPKKYAERPRISIGVPALDKMMGGGVRAGDSTLVTGPSGSGKSILGSQFIVEGCRSGEAGVIVLFEENTEAYIARAASLGLDLTAPQLEGTLKILYLRPLDLSVDEAVYEIVSAIQKIKAKRVVIDSLAGFELALAPGFRSDFRESLYRMIGVMTRLGVTVLSTIEIQEKFTSFGLSEYAISFLADNIIRFRYISTNSQLRKLVAIVKMRNSEHSNDLHEYYITSKGLSIDKLFNGYRGLISGIPGPLDFDPKRRFKILEWLKTKFFNNSKSKK